MSRSVTRSIFWLSLLVAVSLAQTSGNAIREVEGYNTEGRERPIFNYRRNGVKIDMRIVPAVNATVASSRSDEDGFPQFPFREIGRCVIGLSLTCVQKRVARFLDIVSHLREITLFGESVKLIRLKEIPKKTVEEQRALIGASERIDRSIDDFFDTFALRITLPKWNGNKNQIDVMMDDTDPAVEGRGGKGGGGGGKGGGKGGKGGGKGGGCKKMMMMMMVGLKMKMMGMIGMAAMKGMIMSGMSLMISKMMLLHQLMSKKGGMFGGFGGGGGGGGSGGGGQLKEIVLLTKASGGGGGGGGGGCGGGGGGSGCGGGGGSPPPDSYGAPPSGGGGGAGGYDYSGGGGGGGGWGRSFDRRPMSFVKDYMFSQPARESAVMVPQEVMDAPTQLKPLTEHTWNQEVNWNYTTDFVNPDKTKTSQDISKSEVNTQNEQLVNSNLLRPVYAKGWKNYELARTTNADYYPDYDYRQ